MFSESEWSRKSIGDVDVVFHEGLYHLFYLVLPTHDFIAHAISDNALNWRRVDNALFIGDPGSWDDLMLWTMHVSPDPHQPGRWRMFYTGLSRRDQGRKQRIGLAVSDDLFHWRKAPVHWRDLRGRNDPEKVKQARARAARSVANNIKAPFDAESSFPLEPDPRFYEASLDGERGWISFRDPFYHREGDRGWLVMAARVGSGPLIRRGCVGFMEEVEPNHFRALPPLHTPMLYDDIEVPNLFRLEEDYYLVGSLREDAKIRYWHTSDLSRPWRNYYDNVLLPRGNYAARVSRDDQGMLLWNFYTKEVNTRTHNLLPPPKRLRRAPDGQLCVGTFEGLGRRARESLDVCCLHTLKQARRETFCRVGDGSLHLVSEAGFQGFVFDEVVDSFRMRCGLKLTGLGKCGILSRLDPESHDGYYLALDLMKGDAQLRAWRTGPVGSGEQMMRFEALQEGAWFTEEPGNVRLQWIAFGSYLELSINGEIVLSLADQTFRSGLLGFYVETAALEIRDLVVESLEPPTQADEHLAKGGSLGSARRPIRPERP
ncbi:MAG: glycosyl hydrolase [Verrucomicrobia bacterium]|nr:MAG: glycosyl hydrolase [Verrucomicrobiota bacterium]